MANTLEIVIKAVDKASKTIQGVSDSTGQLEKGLGKTSKAAGLVDAALGAIGSIATVAGIAGVTTKIVSQAAELAKLGREVERVGTAYTNLWGGEAAEGLERLREAANGTISDMDLMLAANKAQLLGVGSGIEDLAKLMQVAQERGRAMGLTTSQAFSDIVTGIGRVSPLILDNLGIVVDAENTYAAYAESIGKAADELTEAEKKQALVNRVIADARDIALDSAGQWEALAAAQANVRAEIGMVIDAFIEETGAVERLTEGLNGLRAALEMERSASASAKDMTAQFTATLERSISAAGMTEVLYQRMERGQRSLEVAFRDGRITAEEYQAGINKLEDELRAATGQMSLAEIQAADLQESIVRSTVAAFDAARGFRTAGAAAMEMGRDFSWAASMGIGIGDVYTGGQYVYGMKSFGERGAIDAYLKYYREQREYATDAAKAEAQINKQRLSQQSAYAAESIRIAEQQYAQLRGIVESVLMPTQVTAADLAATAAGTYVDKWDEAVRRYRMAEKGHTPEEIAEYERKFYGGYLLEDVNWAAIVADVKQKLADQAAKEALVAEAMRQVRLAGVTASDAALSKAMGIADYAVIGEEVGQQLSMGLSASGLATVFTEDFEAELVTLQGRWETMGTTIAGWMVQAFKSSMTIAVGGEVPGRASGGYASGLTLVGEQGPELVSLPRGSYVHDNRESERMMGGTSVTFGPAAIVIQGNATARDVEIGVLRGLRAAGVGV